MIDGYRLYGIQLS